MLYAQLVAQARTPYFYQVLSVPDTVTGRFEMVVLHAFLALRRLKDGGEAAAATAQALSDTLFDDMDHSLREIGVGDLSVGPKIRKMAQAFLGRVKAYDTAIGGPAMEAALKRNVFAELKTADEAATSLAVYIERAHDTLQQQSLDDICAGTVRFPDPAAALSERRYDA